MFARPDATYATLAAAKAVAAPLPLLIGETGYATIPDNPRDPRIANSRAMQEAWQGHYLRTIAHAAQTLDLPVPAPWTLYNFAPGAIPAEMRISAVAFQYHYGLLRTDGSAKPAYGVVGKVFDAQPIDESVNNGFERGALEAGLDAARVAARRPGRRLLRPLDGDRAQRARICVHPGQRR